MARGYLTPATIPATLTRRWICIPNEPYIIAALNGALLELSFAYNWENFGAVDKETIAEVFRLAVLEAHATGSDCMPIVHQPTILADQKAQNTDGGTFTNGAWRVRDLTEIEGNLFNGVVLASNQFTIPAGTWLIEWSAPAYEVGQHQTRLFEIDGSSVVKYGTVMQGGGSTDAVTRSEGVWSAKINTALTLRIEHRSSGTKATNGFGVKANLAVERYTFVKVFPIS